MPMTSSGRHTSPDILEQSERPRHRAVRDHVRRKQPGVPAPARIGIDAVHAQCGEGHATRSRLTR